MTTRCRTASGYGRNGRRSAAAHWPAYDRDTKGRSYLPSPDPHYRVVGVAWQPAGTVTDPAHAFGPSAPHGVPDMLRGRGR
ncbi:hypothetical protein [Streptomyces sp. NBC_01363]|uniref:hypothetical protein n=1 Tax=Streptomyces sp. NBC_01363 TaxID=2903840 RepID=UPI00224E0D2E|nr:hypothetical protein [Streptomyces sp. NBC_01363]MCX4730369.1 hypothetical protein [Streptomyces sp. NBC_01363]